MIELTKSWLFYLNDVHHRPRCEKFPRSRYSHTRTFHSPFFCSCKEKLREKPKSYFTILTEMYGKRFFWAVERRVPYGIAIVSVFRISCNFSCSRHYMLNTLLCYMASESEPLSKQTKNEGKMDKNDGKNVLLNLFHFISSIWFCWYFSLLFLFVLSLLPAIWLTLCPEGESLTLNWSTKQTKLP